MFDGLEFELREPEPQQPLTVDAMLELMKTMEKAKKRILCHPDAYERIDVLVRNEGYGAFFKVIPCAWLEPGQALVMQSEADEDAELQAVLKRLAAEQAEKLRRDCEDWQERERRKAEMLAYLRPGYLVNQPPTWPAIVAGP